LAIPTIFVPVLIVTPVVLDQYRLYAEAPVTALQSRVTRFAPPVALTPAGAAGMVAAAVVALVVAETSAEAGPLRPLVTA
jgi:hypothetical protein